MPVRLIPKDLLSALPLKLHPRQRRILVTLCALRGPDPDTWDRTLYARVLELWGDRVNRPRRVSVVSALIELESFFVVSNIQDHDPDNYSVEVDE